MPINRTPELINVGKDKGLTIVSPDVHLYYPHAKIMQMVGKHNNYRPSYKVANRRPEFMAGYAKSEINEAQQEMQKIGTKVFSPKDLRLEFGDVSVILASLAQNAQIRITDHDVWPYVNGQGRHSNIFERMERTADDISAKNIEKPLRELFILLASAINHSPIQFDFITSLGEIILKNRLNHYAPYYSGKDVLNDNKPLDEDEQVAQYTHSVAALRLFRKAFAGPDGLPVEAHAPYAIPIHDFRNSPWALSLIKEIIRLEQQTPQKSAIT